MLKITIRPSENNIRFIYMTIGLLDYFFYDNRFESASIAPKHPEKFDYKFYDKLKEICLPIRDGKVLELNSEHYRVFLLSVDFNCKVFISSNKFLQHILNTDFRDNTEYNYDELKEFYLKYATEIFENFKKNKTITTEYKQDILESIDWKNINV